MRFLERHPRWAAGLAALVLALALYGLVPESSTQLFNALAEALTAAMKGDDQP